MLKKAYCIIAVALLLALACAPALAVVSPSEQFYVLDQADVLSEALEGEIFFSNPLLEEACGAQLVVVTVKTTGSEAIMVLPSALKARDVKVTPETSSACSIKPFSNSN